MAQMAPGTMTQAAPEVGKGATTVEQLRGAVQASVNARQQRLQAWRDNVDMRVQKLFGGQIGDDDVRDRTSSPEDWSRTKQKQSQLMFTLPKIIAKADRPEFKSFEAKVSAMMNKSLKTGVKAAYMIDECLADAVNATGVMVSSVAVEEYRRPTTMQGPTLDEAGQPTLDEQGMPIMGPQEIMQPVAKRFSWERISGAAFLWPAEFTKSDWDEAPWLGYETWPTLAMARKIWGEKIPEDYTGCVKPALLAEDIKDARSSTDTAANYCKIQVIWYRAVLYDEDAYHPDHLRRIVFLDGHSEPLEQGDTNWQKWVEGTPAVPPTPAQPAGVDPTTGQATPEVPENPGKAATPGHFIGIKTFPIRVETLTYVSDMAIPPSDSQAGRPQVKELIRSRTQMLRQRDQSIPIRWYDTNRMDSTIADALRAGTWQDMIPVNGPGTNVIGEVSRAQYPRENFQFQNVLNSDLDRAWSLSNNQLATTNSTDRSATEVQAISSAAQIRLDYEKSRVNRYLAQGCSVLFSLMQLFMDGTDYVEVIGESGAKVMEGLTKADLAGASYEFDFVPDTSDRVDIVTRQNNALKMYNVMANSQTVNRQAFEAEIMATHGFDPAEFVVQPQPSGPPPPNISYRFGTEDMLNPLAVAIMQKTQKITQAEIGSAAMLIMDSMKQIMDAKQKLGMDAASMAMGAPMQAPPAGAQVEEGQTPLEPVTPPTPNEPILKRLGDGTRMM